MIWFICWSTLRLLLCCTLKLYQEFTERERGRERGREGGRERKRERERNKWMADTCASSWSELNIYSVPYIHTTSSVERLLYIQYHMVIQRQFQQGGFTHTVPYGAHIWFWQPLVNLLKKWRVELQSHRTCSCNLATQPYSSKHMCYN